MWLVNTKPQNKQMHCQITLRRTCNPCGCTMKMSSRYHKRTTKIDGMGPFTIDNTNFLLDIKTLKFYTECFINLWNSCNV